MSTPLDLSGRYLVEGWPKIAVYIVGFEQQIVYDEDGLDAPEQIDNPDRVLVVMVGDDAKHNVGVDELIPIDPSTVCSCGQIGCWSDASHA